MTPLFSFVANDDIALSISSNMANAAANAAVAKERVERIKRGENVEGGLGKQLSLEDYVRIMRDAGMTTGDIEHCMQASQVCDVFGFETMTKAIHETTERAQRNVVRRLHRRIDESAR
jgi:predicted transcriptional regulator of viral defense system